MTGGNGRLPGCAPDVAGLTRPPRRFHSAESPPTFARFAHGHRGKSDGHAVCADSRRGRHCVSQRQCERRGMAAPCRSCRDLPAGCLVWLGRHDLYPYFRARARAGTSFSDQPLWSAVRGDHGVESGENRSRREEGPGHALSRQSGRLHHPQCAAHEPRRCPLHHPSAFDRWRRGGRTGGRIAAARPARDDGGRGLRSISTNATGWSRISATST